nr:MAG TPA: hypothetical protein [Caudoviricetes sp.]
MAWVPVTPRLARPTPPYLSRRKRAKTSYQWWGGRSSVRRFRAPPPFNRGTYE